MPSPHRPRFKALAAPLMLAVPVLLAQIAPAAAQTDMRLIIQRLDRLERDVATLYSRGGGGGPPRAGGGPAGPADAAFNERTELRFETIESQLRDLTGQVERALHDVDRINVRLDRLVADVDFRLSKLEGGSPGGGAGGASVSVGGPGPGGGGPAGAAPARSPEPPNGSRSGGEPPGARPASPPPAPADDGGRAPPPPGGTQSVSAPPLPAGSAAEQYDNAMALLRQGRYADAGAAFGSFLRQHPNHPFSENAQYWLGETYYVRQKYQEAGEAFLEGYRKYPKGTKAPDNLLKLGLSMAALNKSHEACVALGRLKEYPMAPPTIQSRAESERRRLQCGG